MKTFLSNIFTKNNIKHIMLSAIYYFTLLIFSKVLFSVIPGQEVRIANFLAPVLGIIWGPTAAVGISIASFAGDILFDSAFYIAITGAIANFFLTYIPYKLWHTVKVRSEDRYFLTDAKSVFKYIYIVLITSLTVGAFLAMIVESSRISLTREVLFSLILYNVDLSFVVGIPVLILLSHSKVKAYLPIGEKRKLGSAIYYDSLLYIVTFIGVGYIFLSNQSNNEMNPNFAFLIWMLMFLLLTLFMQKPMIARQITGTQARDLVKQSIKAKITYGFILLVLGFVGLMGAFVYLADMNNLLLEPSLVWNYFSMSMVWLIHLFFVVVLLVLWQVERKIVQPLEVLTVAAEQVRNIVYEGVDPSLLKKVLALRKSDEIGVLSNTFGMMMESVDQDVIQIVEAKTKGEEERERSEALLNIAMHHQLPSNISLFKGSHHFDIYAELYPSEKKSSDFYDFFLINDHQLFMCMAKSVDQDALLMSTIKTLITHDAKLGYSPKKILNNINHQLCKDNIKELFHMVFMGIVELDTGTLKYLKIGDPVSILCKNDKIIEYLDSKNDISLAQQEGTSYSELELTLARGDMLFLSTDAFTRTLNNENEVFAKQCLEKVIDTYNEENDDASRILPHLKNEIDTAMNDVKQVDDITMVLLKYH
jgi:sigma-B regulation protein RsbU (phosphoserine phosphatase)